MQMTATQKRPEGTSFSALLGRLNERHTLLVLNCDV